jgi:DNA-binding beta-propeller fold protein YncE
MFKRFRVLTHSVLVCLAVLVAPIASAGATTSTPLSGSEAATFLWSTTGGPEPLGWAEQITVDPDGNLWVADGPSSRFQIFSPDGEFIEFWGSAGTTEGSFDFLAPESAGMAPGAALGSVAFDSDGSLYVADIGNHRIQKFGPDREFVKAWGTEGEGDGQFLAPLDIAVNSQGTVFVSDEALHLIQAFNSAGEFLFAFGGVGSGDGQFKIPWGIASGPGDLLWVTDFDNNRVQAFTSDGTFVRSIGGFGTDPGKLIGPNDVAVDADGRIYVAEQGIPRVQIFAADGTSLAIFGGPGAEEGSFAGLAGIAVDDNGGIYVAEWELKRVQKFQLSEELVGSPGPGTPTGSPEAAFPGPV